MHLWDESPFTLPKCVCRGGRRFGRRHRWSSVAPSPYRPRRPRPSGPRETPPRRRGCQGGGPRPRSDGLAGGGWGGPNFCSDPAQGDVSALAAIDRGPSRRVTPSACLYLLTRGGAKIFLRIRMYLLLRGGAKIYLQNRMYLFSRRGAKMEFPKYQFRNRFTTK